MTIADAISLVDKLKPNQYEQELKLKWLADLDEMIKKDIIDKHDGADEVSFTKYTTATALDTELLVTEVYSDIYRWYLSAQIDLANEELGKYNNSIILYNNCLSNFRNYYRRTHMPIQHNVKFTRG